MRPMPNDEAGYDDFEIACTFLFALSVSTAFLGFIETAGGTSAFAIAMGASVPTIGWVALQEFLKGGVLRGGFLFGWFVASFAFSYVIISLPLRIAAI